MLRIAAILVSVILAWGLPPPTAGAQIRIDITEGVPDPVPIAIVPFEGKESRSTEYGRNVASVISADLGGSGLFRPLDEKAFLSRPARIDVQPRFPNWRGIGAQFLVNGQTSFQDDGRIRIEVRLWDVLEQRQLEGLAYRSAPANWRRVAHIVADAIYKRVTGEEGYFDSRIVYVAESGPANNRVKRLAVMDQDGANHSYLTGGNNYALTPRFSPNRQEITYLSYRGNRRAPRVHILHLDTEQRETLGQFANMTFAPRFSPEGDKVLMSMAADGNTDIFEMLLSDRTTRRLTHGPAIDTSPSFDPEARRIVFNSDRGGTQQLYTMNADGSDVARISRGRGRYGTPVWSPRGDLIAFTKIYREEFHIGVMRPDGTGERLLASDYHVEGPTWSPNGRVLAFFRLTRGDARGRDRSSRLWKVDITGRNLRELPTPGDASDPAWSPLSP